MLIHTLFLFKLGTCFQYQYIIKAEKLGVDFFLINSVPVMATAYLTQNFNVKEIPQSQRQILQCEVTFFQW